MTDYIILNNYQDYDCKGIKLGCPKKINNMTFSEIRYNSDNKNKQLYIQTPNLILGNLQWDIEVDGVVKNAYLNLYLRENKCQDFEKLINSIDNFISRKIWETKKHWDLNQDTPSIKIEKYYVPVIGFGKCLRLELNVSYKNDEKYLDTEIYDQDNEELPISLLKPEYLAKSLILIKGVMKKDNYYSLVIELKQLKVKIPECVFDNCQLSDYEEEYEPDNLDFCENYEY